MEKRCFRCLCVLPLDAFYAHPKMSDGHLNKCKRCTKSDAAAHRAANLEQVRKYDRARSSMPHRVALRSQVTAAWRRQHPLRRAAQVALGNAVRDGLVKRWPVCAIPTCDLAPEAHHPDYSQPLDVVWLCRAHHMQAHAIKP